MAIESLLGDLPLKWETTTLGDACQRGGGFIQTGPFGSQLHASDYVEVGIPSIMPKNIGDNRVVPDGIARITEKDAKRLERYLVRSGDIVYSRRGDVERRALITEQEDGWLCGTGCLRVRFGSFDYVDPLYASYYLGDLAVREWIVRHAIGATMPNLNTSILSALPFVLPSLSEQRAIAGILGVLDSKIEVNRRMNATLELMVQAVFRQWFVENPDVPKWKSVTLSEICTTQYGFTASASNESVGPKFLRITDMNKEPWIVWADVPYCKINEKDFEKYKLSIGDILVSRMADPGKVGIIEEEVRAVFASYLVRLKFMDLAWAYFGYYFLRSDYYLEYANGAKSGSVQSGMNARVITDVNISIPPDEKVISFFETIKPFRNMIVANLKESRTLGSLRDSLLPKLMRGEVRVKS